MNDKEKLSVLAQTINVRVVACSKPVTTAEESAKVLSQLETISKNWCDEKRTSSAPSASTIMAKLFSEIHKFVKGTTKTADGIEYNPHAVLAYPCHRLYLREVGEIFDMPTFIDYCRQPTIEKLRPLCYLLQEKSFPREGDDGQTIKKNLFYLTSLIVPTCFKFQLCPVLKKGGGRLKKRNQTLLLIMMHVNYLLW
jgi:hypothetical protein